MPRIITGARAGDSALIVADVLWMASSTGDSMSIRGGSASLYTDALLRVLRDHDPPTYDAAQAAIRGLLAAHEQRVPSIAYLGPGRGSFAGRPFRP